MLWLVGMMASGKTAVGQALADELGLPFADTDAIVEERVGMPVRAFWEAKGQEAFRDVEEQAVAALAAGGVGVVATGGGVVLRPSNVEAMRSAGQVIWLEASPPVLADRAVPSTRPLLASTDVVEQLQEILAVRSGLYSAAADDRIETDGKTIDEVVAEVVGMFV